MSSSQPGVAIPVKLRPVIIRITVMIAIKTMPAVPVVVVQAGNRIDNKV